VFDGRQPTNAYAFTEKDVDRSKLVVVNSVSKMYAMTGFRVGWAIGKPRTGQGDDQHPVAADLGPATPSQWAAVGALKRRAELRRRSAPDAAEQPRRAGGAAAGDPGGEGGEAGRTFFAFPDFSAYEKSSQKLADLLLDKVRVVTVPGKEFGMEGHLRLSFCGTLKEIKEGVGADPVALDPHAPNELFLGSAQTGEGLAMSAPGRPKREWLPLGGRREAPRGSNERIPCRSPRRRSARRPCRQRLRPREPRAGPPAPRLLEPARGGRCTRRRSFRREGHVAADGPFVVGTGKAHGARRADKFITREATSEDKVWWGEHNRPFTPPNFNTLLTRMQGYLQGRDVFVQDCLAGADPTTGCRSASSRRKPGIRCSPGRCSQAAQPGCVPQARARVHGDLHAATSTPLR